MVILFSDYIFYGHQFLFFIAPQQTGLWLIVSAGSLFTTHETSNIIEPQDTNQTIKKKLLLLYKACVIMYNRELIK